MYWPETIVLVSGFQIQKNVWFCVDNKIKMLYIKPIKYGKESMVIKAVPRYKC